jgi:putative DNA primase/helicase
MRPQLFVMRDTTAHPEAVHERRDRGAANKDFAWWTAGPDGQAVNTLQGRKVESLPLYGSQHACKWDTSRPVYVVEGEKATMALAHAGHRALGTLGSVTPSDASLAVLIGLDVILWPDNDAPGRRVMQAIARRIASAASLRWAKWPEAPAGGDAADYLAAGLNLDDLQLGPIPAGNVSPARRSALWRRASLAPRSDLAPLVRAVEKASPGNRNKLLFWAAHKAADDGIRQDAAEGDLLAAYLAGALSDIRQREGRATIRSAYR